MITREDVVRLAALARLDIPEDQIESTRADIDKILAYVDRINEATEKLKASGFGAETGVVDTQMVKNSLREDASPHESGAYTEALLDAAPAREGDYLKVKNIL